MDAREIQVRRLRQGSSINMRNMKHKVPLQTGTGLFQTLGLILRPVPVVILIWIAIWVNFIARDLIKGGNLRDYKALIARNAAGRKSYIYGDYLFDFLICVYYNKYIVGAINDKY